MSKVVLGVTGSIAAYKAAELTRLFVNAGDDVHVIMTPSATKFVAPLTFQTLSRNPVGVDEFAAPTDWKPAHISLAQAADIVLVAPATANTLAKMRAGIADNYLLATLLATKAPIAVAPAMNTGMWENAATQENLAVLQARGVKVIAPETGSLACGVTGAGRLAASAGIFVAVKDLLK